MKNENGIIRENYETGAFKYKGEYLNGKRHGKGKEYDYDDTLIFEGEYINGKKMEMEKNIHLVQ